MMKFSANRRRLLAATPAVLATPYLAGCDQPEELPLPPDIPIGPFGAKSTAEEVTAGIDLTGKTALVTGCNSGLGYETMRVLAMRGAHVFGAGRTLEKATAACASVAGKTTPVVIELSDFESVAAGAEDVRQQTDTLDMLICNAGIMELPELELVNGVERQFAVNHLGHFVLVNQLLPQVIAAPQGRVVMVSSGHALRNAPPEGIDFDNLAGERSYDPTLAYGRSKLANVLCALELSQRLQGTTTTANALRPGVIPTNLGRHMPRWKVITLETVGRLFTKTVGQGAATTCYVATAPALSNVSGHFFNHCNPERPGGFIEDRKLATQLWSVSEKLTAAYL